MFRQALHSEEFYTLVQYYQKANVDDSGVEEFFRVLQAAKKSKRQPCWARQDTTLLEDSDKRVVALSPSDRTFERSMAAFQKLMPTIGSRPVLVGSPEPNDTSVVLWVQCGEVKMLLGADLEETTNPNSGWTVILDKSVSRKGKANYFKVPHHGSDNGHVERVWKEILTDDVIATLTPFKGGSTLLPKREDAERTDQFARESSLCVRMGLDTLTHTVGAGLV